MSVPTTAQNIARIREEIGARIAQYLRARHPRDTAKHVARDTGSAVATTRRWLEGLFPDSRGVVALAVCYGPHFVNFVLRPAFDARDPETAAELLAEIATEIRAHEALLHREIVNEARDIAALPFVRAAGRGRARGVAQVAGHASPMAGAGPHRNSAHA